MPKPRNRALEQKLIASWREGETQAELAKRLKIPDASAVSRAIRRLTAEGLWSHGGPAHGGARPGAGRPMLPPSAAPASAPELAGSEAQGHGMLTVRLPWPLFRRFKDHCYVKRQSQAGAVAKALSAYLAAEDG